MDRRFRIAGSALLLALPACLLVSGCGSSIRFAADTVIDGRGNVVRATRLASSGGASFDDLGTQYDLLPDGEWSESVETRPSSTPNVEPYRVYNREYSLTRRYERGAAIPGDYRRRAYGSDQAAYNEIAVRTRRLWFVDVYEYEESFTDIPTIESMTRAVRGAYDDVIEILTQEIVALGATGLAPQEISDLLEVRFSPLLERLVTLLTEKCAAPSAPAIDDCLEELEQEPDIGLLTAVLENREVFLAELTELFPAPEGVSGQDWSLRLELEVFNDAGNRLADYPDEAWLESFGTDFFGAHNLTIFDSYPFEITLRMPGLIVSTNARERGAGLLTWSFDHEEFILNDLKLSARSRIVHRNRILAAAALIPLLPIVWLGFGASSRRSEERTE